MKIFILVLCFCFAAAKESLLDDLDKLLSSDTNKEDGVLEKLNEALAGKNEYESILMDGPEDNENEPKFGYCLDGKTPADGPSQRGCAKKLCYDEKVTQCDNDFKGLSKYEKKKKCYKGYVYYRNRCPYTCGFCKSRSPTLECEETYKNRAKFGCCWDGTLALREDKSDCIVCMDFHPHTCGQFFANRDGEKCATNSYRIRQFLDRRCPKMCGRCTRA